MPLSTTLTSPRFGPWEGLSRTAHSAGFRVRAFRAESSMAAETATANCWNICPVMPGMKATGTKTASNTEVMAIIGAVISPMAFLAASAGDSCGSFSMIASTASTTMIASSTTIPMATTRASRETVFAEKPNASITANAPIIDTGTATIRIRVARKLPRDR